MPAREPQGLDRAEETKATCSCLPSPVAACKFSHSIQTPASRLWTLGKAQACSHVQLDFQVPLWRNRAKRNKNVSRAPTAGPPQSLGLLLSCACVWVLCEPHGDYCAIISDGARCHGDSAAKHHEPFAAGPSVVERWVVLAQDLLDISATLAAEATWVRLENAPPGSLLWQSAGGLHHPGLSVGCMYVLVSFCQLDTRLGLPEMTESQLRDCLHQTVLWANV